MIQTESAPAASSAAAPTSASKPSIAPPSLNTPTEAASTSCGPHAAPDPSWMPVSAVPLDAVFQWTWCAAPHPLYQGYVCGHGTFAQFGAVAVRGESALQGIHPDDPHYNEYTAQEQIYSFASSRAASDAFAAIQSGAHTCAAAASSSPTAPGVHQTAAGPQSAAFAIYPVPVSSSSFGGDVRETHEYLAQHGAVIAALDVVTATATGTPSRLYLSDVRDQSVQFRRRSGADVRESGSLGVSLGGPVSAATVIGRADDWSSQAVPYTGQSGNWDNSPWSFWTDSQVGGPCRQDCSGFVSMAWGLAADTNTNGLPAYSHELTSNGNPDPSQLQPGDALIAGGHTVIFNGWYDSAHTKYYAIEETPPNVIGGDNSDLMPYPYWSTNGVPDGAVSGEFGDTYWPYRYNNLTSSGTGSGSTTSSLISAVAQSGSGTVDAFYKSSSGAVGHAYYTAGTGLAGARRYGWYSADRRRAFGGHYLKWHC